MANPAQAPASLGQRIKRLRKQRKLSRDQLAERVGVQRLDLVRIEKGERQVDLDTLVRIFDVLEGNGPSGGVSGPAAARQPPPPPRSSALKARDIGIPMG